jgi:ERCC4-type nuclease
LLQQQVKKSLNKFTVIVDTREQKPYLFKRCGNIERCVRKKLDHGDYQIDNLPNLITIERKKDVNELILNLTKHRKRFIAELERMQSSKYRFVIVEDYWSSIWKSSFSKASPNSIFGSIVAFEIRYGVHFVFCGNRRFAMSMTRQLLTRAYKEMYEKNS